MPLVSIAVPVYRTEPYLDGCIASIAAQTFRDFECFLIEDGSPDGCGAICDAWAAKDSRFIAIHKENGGQVSCWRLAIERAGGRWLIFVDSDDRLAPYALETILAQQARTPRSVLLWRWTHDADSFCPPAGPPAVTHFGRADLGRMYLDSLLYYTWGRLFSLALVREKQVRPPQDLVYGNDLLFCTDYLQACLESGLYEDLALIEEPLYFYRTDNAASVTARLQPRYCADELITTRYLLGFLDGLPEVPADDRALCLLHRLRTLAEGLGYVLAAEEGSAAARRQKARDVLHDGAFQRLLAECRAQKLYSPHAFWLRHGMVKPSGFFYRLKTSRPRWYHRFYWAGWWLHTLFTGKKSPLLF